MSVLIGTRIGTRIGTVVGSSAGAEPDLPYQTGMTRRHRADSHLLDEFGNVQQIYDLSAADLDSYSQDVAARRPGLAAAHALFGGRPAWDCSLGSKGWSLPPLPAIVGASGGELFLVMVSATASQPQFGNFAHLNSADALTNNYTGGLFYASEFSNIRRNAISPAVDPEDYCYIYNSFGKTALWELRQNSNVLFSTETNTVGNHAVDGKFVLGSYFSFVSTFQGLIAEMIYYDHVLETADRAANTAFLADYYGVSM